MGLSGQKYIDSSRNELLSERDELLHQIDNLKKRNAELEKLEVQNFHNSSKLSQLRNLMRVLLGSYKGMVVFKDRNLIYRVVNDVFCNFIGKKEHEVVGKTDYDIFPKNEAEINREGDLSVISSRRPLVQNKLITGNKKKEFLKIVTNPVFTELGEFEGVLISSYDISEAYETEVTGFDTHMKILTQSSNGFVTIQNTLGQVLQLNKTGENESDVVTDSALEELKKVYPDDDEQSIFEETIEAGEVFSERIIQLYKDKVVPVEIYSKLVDYKNQPAVLSVVRDISERKNAEKLLKLKVEEQSIILDNIELQVWFLINASTYGIVNKSHAEFIGKEKDLIEYKNLFEVYDKETAEKIIHSNLEIFDSKKQLRFQEWVAPAGGEKRLLNIVKTPKLDMNGNVELILCTAEDITERYNAEEELKKYLEELYETKDLMEEKAFDLVQLNLKLEESEEELRKLNASKDKFFSIIAHDLKSPFTALLGYTDILVNDFNELSSEEIQEFICSLHETSRNVFQLLEGLLSWSRIQTGRMPYEPEIFDLFEVGELVVKLFGKNAERKNVLLTNRIRPNTEIFADKEMMNGVIRNLVSNAIKFTPCEGSITIKSKDIGECYEISVCDTGVGISKNDIEKLFKIDVHHTTKGTHDEMGTGIGLILCKELIEKNFGTIWVESELNKGTKFIFTIPKAKK